MPCIYPFQTYQSARYATVWRTKRSKINLIYCGASVELFESEKSCTWRKSARKMRLRKKKDKVTEKEFQDEILKAVRTQWIGMPNLAVIRFLVFKHAMLVTASQLCCQSTQTTRPAAPRKDQQFQNRLQQWMNSNDEFGSLHGERAISKTTVNDKLTLKILGVSGEAMRTTALKAKMKLTNAAVCWMDHGGLRRTSA